MRSTGYTNTGYFTLGLDYGRPMLVFDVRRFLDYLQRNGGYSELIQWAERGCDPPVFEHGMFVWIYSPGPMPNHRLYS